MRDVPRFNVVEAVTPVGNAPCADCRGPITDTYFEADRGVICAACHTRAAGTTARPMSNAFGRATAFGVLAAIASSAGYFALLAATGREITVLILLIGFGIGKAVRIGSRGRGGRRFQWLAVALTYFAVAATYVPFVMKGYSRDSIADAESFTIPNMDARYVGVASAATSTVSAAPSLGSTAVGFGGLLLLALAAPLLEGANNILGLLFMLGAIAQAWRMNRSTARVITGPYHVRATAVSS